MGLIENLSSDLEAGRTTSRDLVEGCLERILDSTGEGAQTFVQVDPEAVRAQADAADKLRSVNAHSSPFAGIPISTKDLFDQRGQKTKAGSVVLNDVPAVKDDGVAIKRLKACGFVLIGRTNMTEFAYSGLGLNPHYGTPLNPYDRSSARIPGGSSSGAAISVTDNMAFAGLGSDTGGSCRIPAAFCGITGFKPTASRVPMTGTYPLSPSLDSIGSLASSVSCCAVIDAAISGDCRMIGAPHAQLVGLRIAALTNYVLEDMDSYVAEVYFKTLEKLNSAGAILTNISLPELDRLPEINSKGGFVAAEAYAEHRDLLASRSLEFDPRVSSRMMKGADQSAADYLDLLASRREIIASANIQTQDFDVVAFPTVPIIAPKISEVAGEAEYGRLNLLALRNPTVANFLDRCAISIPVNAPGEAPVGLNLMGETNADRHLISVSKSVEAKVHS